MTQYACVVDFTNDMLIRLFDIVRAPLGSNCVVSLSKAHLLPKSTGNTQEAGLRPNMTEKLFTGTLRINQPTNLFDIEPLESNFDMVTLWPTKVRIISSYFCSKHSLYVHGRTSSQSMS